MKKLMLFLCLVLAGCGGTKMGVTPPPVVDPPPPVKSVFTSISISASSQFVQPGHTQQFTATALDQNQKPMTGITFSWFSNVPSVATIDDHGVVTAVANGYSGIFAASGKLSSVVTLVGGINKGQKIPAPPVVSKLVVTPAMLNFTVGQSQTLTATWFDQYGQVVFGYVEDFEEWYPNGTEITVRNNPEMISIANEVAAGTVVTSWITIINALRPGTVELNVCGGTCNGLTAPKGDGQIYSNVIPVTITASKVTPPPPPPPPPPPAKGTLTITSSASSLLDGQNAQLSGVYSIDPTYGNQVSWTSSNPAVVTIVSTGKFTATAHAVSCVQGSAMITATGTDDQNTALSAALVVTTALHDPLLTTITVSPASAALVIGQSVPFSAVGKDQCGSVLSVPFDWNVQGSATIDQNGVATGTGTSGAQVTASSGSVTSPASTLIVAAYGATANVVLSPASWTLFQVYPLEPNTSKQFSASAFDAYDNPTNETFTWSSTNGFATVNQNGLVSGTNVGVSQITAVASNGVTSNPTTVTVTADPPNLTTITITPQSLTEPEWGFQYQFSLQTALDQYGNGIEPTLPLQWSSDSASASIDSTGTITTGANGSADITATTSGALGNVVTSAPSVVTVSAVTPIAAGPWEFVTTDTYGNVSYLEVNLHESQNIISADSDGIVVSLINGPTQNNFVSGTNENEVIALSFGSFTLAGNLSGQQVSGTFTNGSVSGMFVGNPAGDWINHIWSTLGQPGIAMTFPGRYPCVFTKVLPLPRIIPPLGQVSGCELGTSTENNPQQEGSIGNLGVYVVASTPNATLYSFVWNNQMYLSQGGAFLGVLSPE